MEIIGLILLGIVAGVAGGLFGIGGGIIIVPVLVLLFGLTQKTAQGTSLVALIAPVGIFAVMNYYREGQADLMKGVLIGLGFLAGGYLGSRIALGLDPDTMRKSFAVFLVIVGVYMFLKK